MKKLDNNQLFKINGGYKRLIRTGSYFRVQNIIKWLFQFIPTK